MKLYPLCIVLIAMVLGGCTEKEPTKSGSIENPASDPIQTLWVADQISGMMGMWMRNQQRYLITDSTLSYQGVDLKMGDGIMAEIYSAENPIVSHRKNEHGGVIEYRQAPGELLTITQEMDEDREQFGAPWRSAEPYVDEEDTPNSLLAYRWLDGGRVDLIDLYPEEDGDREGKLKPLDPEAVLASLADPAAFAAQRWIDEESLLTSDPAFVNLVELRKFGETLKEFPDGDEAAFAEVSRALDQAWKAAENALAPEHLGGIGLFTSAHRFASVFPQAMVEAGYHPVFGAFAFARAKDRTNFEAKLSEDDQKVLEAMEARYEPYVDLFEGSLRGLIDGSDPVTGLPEYVTAQDRERSPAPASSEAEDRSREPFETEEPPPPPPPLVPSPPPPLGKPDYRSNGATATPAAQERVPGSTIVTIRNARGYLTAAPAGAESKALTVRIQSEPFSWRVDFKAAPFLNNREDADSPPVPRDFTVRLPEENSRDFLLAGMNNSVSVGPNLSAADQSRWAAGEDGLVFGKKVAITSRTNLVRGFFLVDRDGEVMLQEGGEESGQWIFEKATP